MKIFEVKPDNAVCAGRYGCEWLRRADLRDVPMARWPDYVRPWLGLNYGQFAGRFLREHNYKEIATLIDPDFLRQGVRAEELRTVNLNSITPFDGDTMIVDVVSSRYAEENFHIYYSRFKFLQWAEVVADTETSPLDSARLLIWNGDLRLHCSCPSFLYWGYAWLLSVLDSAIYPEDRPPEIRNPGQRGIVCKHLNRALRVFPFLATDIAKEIRRQRA